MENQDKKEPFSYLGKMEQEEGSKKLSSFGTLFDKTWQVYKNNFLKLVGITALPYIPALCLFILMVIINASIDNLAQGPGLFILLGIGLVFIPLWVVASLWSSAALIYVVKARDEKKDIITIYKESRPFVFSVWWADLLAALVIGGGFLFFIIPGLYLAVLFSFTSIVVVDEEKKGPKAFFRSSQLVKGNWFGIFLRSLLMGIIVLGVAILVNLFLGWIPLVGALTTILISPVAVIWLYLLYENLKEIKREEYEPPTSLFKVAVVALAAFALIALAAIPVLVFGSLNKSKDKAGEIVVMTRMNELRALAEIHRSAETGYDFSCQEDEFSEVCSDIRERTGREPTIHLTGEEYCSYIKLNSRDYYCIDSKGESKKTRLDPATSCNDSSFSCPGSDSYYN